MGPDERNKVKVLLTGCTAQHISSAVNNRIPTFAGLVRDALESQGAEVVWIEPHMEMDQDFISMFDSVIVGLASPASVASNHIYPALWVANLARESSKLTLMVDTPEPHRLWAGLMSVVQNPDSLVKDFYARRKGFRQAAQPEKQEVLLALVDTLVGQEWPLVIAPALPWTDKSFLTRHIPQLAADQSVGLILDRGMNLPIYNPIVDSVEKKIWYSDSMTSNWVAKTLGTLAYSAEPIRASRTDTCEDIANKIRGSLGLLLTTHRGNEPWWSPLVMIALLQRVPVVSEWRHTSILGDPWSMLPATVEMMEPDERESFAKEQSMAYLRSLPEFSDEAVRLASLIEHTNRASQPLLA